MSADLAGCDALGRIAEDEALFACQYAIILFNGSRTYGNEVQKAKDKDEDT